MDIWQILMTPFSWLLKQFCLIFDSYGIALILFTIVVKLILFPFSLKSKKSMIQMNILSARQREIQKKYPNDRNKQNEELQKLYSEHGVNPMGGCLWSFIPLLILWPLYAIIRRPLKYMMGLADSATNAVFSALGLTGLTAGQGYGELTAASMLTESNLASVGAAAGVSSLFVINFNFLGLDLSQIPNWKFWDGGISWQSVGLFLLPVISAGLSALSSVIMTKTNAMNRQQEQNMAAQNRTMLIMMPLLSLWIGFTLPAGMCIYWISNSVLSVVQELICGKILKKDYEEAQRKMAEQEAAAKAAEKERRRLAAERKAAALAEQKAAARRPRKGKRTAAEAQAEAERLGAIQEASRVGMRTYARGRAYDPNRYPVTPYHDPDLKYKPAQEEVTELTDEEKKILAESGAENAALLEKATAPVEEPAPETVEAEAPAGEAAEEPVTPESAPETAEETDTVRFETPEYDKPDYDNDSEKKE